MLRYIPSAELKAAFKKMLEEQAEACVNGQACDMAASVRKNYALLQFVNAADLSAILIKMGLILPGTDIQAEVSKADVFERENRKLCSISVYKQQQPIQGEPNTYYTITYEDGKLISFEMASYEGCERSFCLGIGLLFVDYSK